MKESGYKNDKKWGPRTIRAFLFKYQIARLLLEKDTNPNSILDAFINAKLNEKYDNIMYEIVKQVK